jgi:hypothetical protein
VYTEQGCAKFVVASGGEIEVQSGGTFDLQSGATTDFSSGIALDGGTLSWDDDADTASVEGSDDVINHTLGAAAGYHAFLTGNVKVGNGTPGTAQDGEDLYVEGGFEADGTARFDGAVTLNSTLDVDGNITSGTGGITLADTIAVTGAADFASTVQFGTDNLYPLGYASSGYQMVCGTSGVFTETTSVSVSGLTTVTHVLALQITDPADTAAIISVDQPTTSTVTFNSWVVTPTVGVGTTGVNIYYCAVGNQ